MSITMLFSACSKDPETKPITTDPEVKVGDILVYTMLMNPVCKVPTRAVIDAAKAALYTGHIGDGKIFVYNIENVVKIRTNEEGYDALQDD